MKEYMKRFIYSGLLIRHNKNYKEITNLNSTNEFSDFHDERLLNLISHAFTNVPFYKRIFNGFDLDKSSFTLDQIPILTKEIVRTNFKNLTSQDYKKRTWFYNSSGGSTGEPLKIIQDDQTVKWSNIGHYYYCKNMLGIDEPIAKKVIIWGNERDVFGQRASFKERFYRNITKSVLLNGFLMNEDNMYKYINTINTYKPEYIRGYASSLYEICKFADRKKIDLYTPKIIESTSENLSTEMREKIESSFGTKVYDFYGSREVSSIAGECEKGSLHIFTFKNSVEVLDRNNKPVKPGEKGNVIITDLANYSFPLIRYEIGDMAILGKDKCKCGNPLPTLKKVVGRITDSFIQKNGTIVPAEYFTQLIGVYCNKGLIKKFQILQEDYDLIRIKMVLYTDINISEKKNIENKIKLVMGKSCKIIWDQVDDIPKTKSGKYLFTKSNVI